MTRVFGSDQLERVKRSAVVFLALSLFVFVPVVRAQESTEETVTEEVVSVPNPGGFLFGLQNAITRVSENTQLFLARTDEQKAALEERFAKREQALMEKIEQSENPERFEKILESLRERHDKRLDSLEQRVEKIKDRREDVGARLQQNLDKLRVREATIEGKLRLLPIKIASRAAERKENRQERIDNRIEKTQVRQASQEARQEKRIDAIQQKREVKQETREQGVQLRNSATPKPAVLEGDLESVQKAGEQVRGAVSGFWDLVKTGLGF